MSVVFIPGETKKRPGVYVRVTNRGGVNTANVPQGTVAAVFRSSWGPLVTAHTVEGGTRELGELFGTAGTVAVAEEAFLGNAGKVVAFRLGGDNAAKASVTLQDTAAIPASVATIAAKYDGARGNGFAVTVRDSLTDATKRELLVYEGTALLQTIAFAKGGGDEADDLVAAVAAQGSAYITATKVAAGNGTLAATSQSALTGGVDPTVEAGSYSTALTALEALTWNVLVTDSEDEAVQATIEAYVERVRNEGKRIMAVLAEPTSVAFATRLTNAKALNNPAVVYVANGFKRAGATVEGYKAAGRVAGMIASAPITASLTHQVVDGATELVGGLTGSQIEQAIDSGALVFSTNTAGQVQVEYGINTLVTLGADQDAGWRKIRRVRTRDNLMDRIVATWDPLVGQLNNNADGRATLVASGNGVIQAMVSEGALIDGSKLYEDPANPAAGESAWFVADVDDLDSGEKFYLTFGYRFSPNS